MGRASINICLILSVVLAVSLTTNGEQLFQESVLVSGQAVAGVETDITSSGVTLRITTDANSTVTLYQISSVTLDLPEDHSSLSFGASSGYKLGLSGNAKVVAAALITADLTVSAAALISGSTEVRCLRMDTEAEAYANVNVKSYNSLTRKIEVDLPDVGVYLFVSASKTLPLPAVFGVSASTSAGADATFSYGNFSLTVQTENDNNVTVNKEAWDSRKPKKALDFFLDIELGAEADMEANLTYTYSEDELQSAGIEARNLVWAYFDATVGGWAIPSGGATVDVSAKTVTHATTHFSNWAVIDGSGNADFVLSLSFGASVSLKKEKKYQMEFSDGLEIDLTLRNSDSKNREFVCTKRTSSDSPSPDFSHVGTFYTFDLTDEQTANIEAVLRCPVNANVMSDAHVSSASELQWKYYDTKAKQWTSPKASSSVDADAQVIVQSTNHFSEWTVSSSPLITLSTWALAASTAALVALL